MQLTQQEILVLRKTFLFHQLTPASYMKLSEQNLPGAFRTELRTGQRLEWPQRRENFLGVVIAGELVERREPAFSDRPLKEGSVLGVIDLFSREHAPQREIEALSRSRMVFFSASQIRALFDACPGMMMRYINFLTARVQEIRWEYLMAATPAAIDRVKQYCAVNASPQPDGRTMVALPHSMAALAGRVHMSRSTLYRCLEQLEEQGIVQKQGHTLLILRPEALRKAMEGGQGMP